MKKINIFVASGSELLEERKQAIIEIHKLRKIFPILNLEIIEWETDLPSGSYHGKTIQEKIDPLLKKSDIVLVLFYSKLGKFSVLEYEMAFQKNKKIFLSFKIKKGFSRESKTKNEQYGQVLDFKDKVEKENKVLFKQYDTVGQFALEDRTVKEWNAATGRCLKMYRLEDKPKLSEYHSKNTLSTKLPTFGNKIYLPASTRNKEDRTLINIPGLWIQGCSFKNLEKNSQWSKKALELMKQ